MMMKSVVRNVAHMLIVGSSVLFLIQLFHSLWEFAGYCLLLMMLAGILDVLRNKMETFWKFLVYHGILFIVGIFISMIGLYKWYTVLWCFWVVYSVVIRLVPVARSLNEPGFTYVILLSVEYFCISATIKNNIAQSLSLIVTACVFLLCLLYGNLASMDEFILAGSFSSRMDEQGIRRLNNRLSLLYMGFFGVLLAVFSLFRVDVVWNTIKRCLYHMIRFVASLIPTAEQIPQEEKEQIQQETTQLFQEMAEEPETFPLMQLFGDILHAVTVVLMVALVIYGIVYAVLYVYRHFHNVKAYEVGDKVIESILFGDGVTRKREHRRFEIHDANPTKRIRRIYKRILKRTRSKQILDFQYWSPKEQVQVLRKHGINEETIEEIKFLYEKARYSEGLATEAEAERMQRELAKKLNKNQKIKGDKKSYE